MILKRTVILLLFLGMASVQAEEEGSTPKARIEKLRKACALKHARLGIWASGKKLGLEARAHLNTAVHLDPACGRARVKLGHRRGSDGRWDTSRKRKIPDDASARKKYDEQILERRLELYEEEARAYAELALSLRGEGRPDLARDLFLHAHFLAPRLEDTAEGLHLKRCEKGLAPEAIAKEVEETPSATKPGGSTMLGGVGGARTKVRVCGAVVAEVAGPEPTAKRIAVLANRALVYTVRRFSREIIPDDWVWLVLTSGPEQFCRFLDGMPMDQGARNTWKTIGSARIFQPRHCVATFYLPDSGDPFQDGAPILIHMMAENIVMTLGGPNVPWWLIEAVGVDAELTVLGRPKTLCVTVESSQGLTLKDDFDDLRRWPATLCRLAALGDLPRLEHLRTAQVQALSPEDVVVGHAYYRLLSLTRPEGAARYFALLREGRDEAEAFREAFNATHEEITGELYRVLLGR